MARSLFTKLVEEQLFDYAVLERDDEHAVLKHQYLETVFAARWHGNLIFGVEGAESRERSRDLLRRLERSPLDTNVLSSEPRLSRPFGG